MYPFLLTIVAASYLWPTGATRQAVWSCIILNSITLAAACSTYFQLCGNGSVGSQAQATGSAGFLQEAVCMRYLAPVPTKEYPKFSRWMLYAERNSSALQQLDAAGAVNMNGSCSSALPAAAPAAASAPGNVSSSSSRKRKRSSGNVSTAALLVPPVHGSSPAAAPLLVNTSGMATLVHPLPAAQPEDGGTVISPVFTMWCTLIALYISRWLLLFRAFPHCMRYTWQLLCGRLACAVAELRLRLLCG
jgi:hypothetical protein